MPESFGKSQPKKVRLKTGQAGGKTPARSAEKIQTAKGTAPPSQGPAVAPTMCKLGFAVATAVN